MSDYYILWLIVLKFYKLYVNEHEKRYSAAKRSTLYIQKTACFIAFFRLKKEQKLRQGFPDNGAEQTAGFSGQKNASMNDL